MPPRPISLSDIALEAGVAKSTVSMALKNHPRISETQRRRIQEIAARMGYANNALLGQLMYELRRSRKQPYVATLAMVNASTDPQVRSRISIVQEWLAGAETRAAQLGYTLDHFWLHEPGLSPARLAQILRTRNVQGVAFYALDPDSMLREWAPIWEQFSTVTIGARHHSPSLHFVSNDQYTTAYRACERLWERGYRRIGTFIETWLDDILERRFIAGYLARKGATNDVPVLYFDNELGIKQKNKLQHQKAFTEWVREYRPDAILCNSNHALTWLKAMNLRIPEDIGVALLDLPREMKGIAAGMEQNPSWTGITAIEVLVGQILRRETGVPPFQQGTMIESTWIPGPTVRKV